jgi:lia operon protein LiaG
VWSSYSEIYLPASYIGDLSIRTSSGNINIDNNFTFNSLNLRTTAGNISISDVVSATSDIRATTGDITINNITGEINAGTTTGLVNITDIAGYGSFGATIGNMKLSFRNVDGDITCNTTGGNITLTIPKGLSFNFSANATGNTNYGTISTPFSDALTVSRKSEYGNVGDNPAFKIHLEAVSGHIVVNYAIKS